MSQNIILGNICDSITYGVTASADFSETEGPKFLRITDITESGVCWDNVPRCSIAMFDKNNLLLRDGDIVVARTGGTVGKSFLVLNPPRAVNASYLLRLRPKRSFVEPDYLNLFLGSSAYWSQLREAARGAAQPNVNATTLAEISLPLPPLPEQRQIAARLKAQLAEVETARQAARAQLREADLLRRCVLQAAFDALADSGCPVFSLKNSAEIVAGITLGRKTKEMELIDVPYMRVANVKDGKLDFSAVKEVSATRREIEKLKLCDGDLLLTEGGDLDKLGRGACWRNQLPLCIHQNHIFRVRLPSDRYNPDFVSYQVGSTYGKAYFFAHAKKTTGIASINQRVLGDFPLLSPPLAKQLQIVTRLKSQLAEVDALHAALTEQQRGLDALPQRLLAQAFDTKVQP